MMAPWSPDQILWYALGNARPDGSEAIQTLMHQLCALASSAGPCSIYRDAEGNLWLDNRADTRSATMFQGHLDTVERAPGAKDLWVAGETIYATMAGKSTILGADDGAGIGILASLIAAKVPALYLFTQGEETGGRGMAHASRQERHRVEGIDRCIAFDRRGATDLCGAQCVGDLASREFVGALSEALGLGHSWATGTWTDNADWQDIIPEIVNLSVGYAGNHTPGETLDITYYRALQAAVLAVDWEDLPTVGVMINQGQGDDSDAIDRALWDICDTLGLHYDSFEAREVREALDRLTDRLTQPSFYGV